MADHLPSSSTSHTIAIITTEPKPPTTIYDRTKDSSDPAELAHLTSPAANPELNQREISANMEPVSVDQSPPRELNGHLNPTKRKRYVVIFIISALISLLGLALILVWIFKLRPKPGVSFDSAPQLTNLHPILMYTFMATLNMYSVLIYRTHFDQPKGFLKILHAIIMGVCLVAGILGVLAIFKAHQMANMADWYSLHSWIGTLTLSLYSIQFIAGFVAFLKPGLSIRARLDLMPWHRFMGVALMILSAVAVVTGIAEFAIFAGDDYNKFKPITFVANFAGMSVVLSALGMGYLLTEPIYRRPQIGEELSLKR